LSKKTLEHPETYLPKEVFVESGWGFIGGVTGSRAGAAAAAVPQSFIASTSAGTTTAAAKAPQKLFLGKYVPATPFKGSFPSPEEVVETNRKVLEQWGRQYATSKQK